MIKPRTGRQLVLSAFVFLAVGGAAVAQETRAAELRALREAKASQLRPPERPGVEHFLFQLEDRLWVERILTPPRGFYLRLGGLTEGGGFGVGPGYHYTTHAYDFRVSAAVSAKKYFSTEASLLLPGAIKDGPFAAVLVRRRDFPEEDFFGLGPESELENRSNFALRDWYAGATGGVRAGDFTAGVNAGYLDPSIGSGTDTRMPSTDAIFAPADVPGLVTQPALAVFEPFAEFNNLDVPLKPTAGGRYRVSWTRYDDRDLDSFSFNRFDADLRQFIPLFRGARVIALRAVVSSAVADSGQQVPFYLQPTLGGGTTLRGFRTHRFRDESAALFQAEYRWRINEFVYGALFYDTGAVARRLVDLGRFEKDYGIGLRAGGPNASAFRIELAFGSGEGTRFLFKFENVF